jgi:hypothetical protein
MSDEAHRLAVLIESTTNALEELRTLNDPRLTSSFRTSNRSEPNPSRDSPNYARRPRHRLSIDTDRIYGASRAALTRARSESPTTTPRMRRPRGPVPARGCGIPRSRLTDPPTQSSGTGDRFLLAAPSQPHRHQRTTPRRRRAITPPVLRSLIPRHAPIYMTKIPRLPGLDQQTAPGALDRPRGNRWSPNPPQTPMILPVTPPLRERRR